MRSYCLPGEYKPLGCDPDKGGTQIVRAQVPFSEFFGYATAVRSLIQGRATYTMEPSHYEPVPTNVQEEIMSAATGGRR